LFFRKQRLAFDVRGQRQGKDRKWRRKPLKSLEMDSEMAVRRFAAAGASLSTVRSIAKWARFERPFGRVRCKGKKTIPA
jgi:hypothetical protein